MRSKIIALGIVLVLLASGIGTVSAFSNSGDGDWKYYKEITVKENSGETLTNFQVLVELKPANFPANAKSDGSDLRFEDESGKELNYWIEEWNYPNNAKIWVKVPSIPANGETKIKMYYSNPSASAVSDGDKVFEFFDDFEGTSLDLSKWTEDAVNNIDHTVNNYFRFEGTTANTWTANSWVTRGSKTGCQHQANWTPINSFIIDFIISVSSSEANQIGQGGVGIVDSDNTVFYFVMLVDGGEDNYHWGWRVVDESGIAYDEANGANIAKWKLTIIRNGDNYKAKFGDSLKDTYTSATPPSKIALVGARDPATYPYLDYIQIDNIRIRKYASTEPTLTLSAECPTTKPTPTITPTPAPPTPPSGKTKAVWLYNPDKYDTATLMTDLKSAGINTIFMSTDVNNIWKYERFVKSTHENGIKAHAMILEDPRCALKENHASSIKVVETVLDYNDKSLAKFDGINIGTEPYVDLDLEEVWQDYITLLEAIHGKTAGKTVLSADIPRWYDGAKIKDLAPNVDFFVIMAYDSGSASWNTASEIEDVVALEMGAIRGEDSKAVIGIGAHEGFRDKGAVERCIEDLYKYYSDDPAFLGVSIFKYETYSGLAGAPEVTVPTGEEVTPIPGFEAVFSIAGLLTVAYLLRRRK